MLLTSHQEHLSHQCELQPLDMVQAHPHLLDQDQAHLEVPNGIDQWLAFHHSRTSGPLGQQVKKVTSVGEYVMDSSLRAVSHRSLFCFQIPRLYHENHYTAIL